MQAELLAVYHLILVQYLQRQHDLRAIEFGSEWESKYWSSVSLSLAASRLKSSPPGQYS